MAATRFYWSDGLLFRVRHMHVPEILHGATWEPYTDIDLSTEGTPLTPDEAVARLPEGAEPAVLDAVDPSVSPV